MYSSFKIINVYYISVFFISIGLFYLSKTGYDIYNIYKNKEKDKNVQNIIDYIFKIILSLISIISGLFLFFISSAACTNSVKILYLLFLAISSTGSGIFQSYAENVDDITKNNIKKYYYVVYSIYFITILVGIFLLPRFLECYS